MSNGPISITKYQDAKPVYLLSTVSKSTPIATGKGTQRNEEVVMPRVVHSYKTNMGAVDRLDLVVSASKLQIKTLKLWKKSVFPHPYTYSGKCVCPVQVKFSRSASPYTSTYKLIICL